MKKKKRIAKKLIDKKLVFVKIDDFIGFCRECGINPIDDDTAVQWLKTTINCIPTTARSSTTKICADVQLVSDHCFFPKYYQCSNCKYMSASLDCAAYCPCCGAEIKHRYYKKRWE